jgi:glycosyltransferase involved in cell wall biosynthesis
MTDPLGSSQVLPYITGLTQKGYQFYLISFEKEARFLTDELRIREYCAKHHINWLPQVYHATPKILGTLKDVFKMATVAKKIVRDDRISVVHCRSYLPAIIGLQLKRKFKIPLLFDMRGFWADERIDGNIWSLKNPIFKMIYNYFKIKEKQFIVESDAIVSLTHAGKNEILKWNLPINQDKITVIPCCADEMFFDEKLINASDQKKLLQELNLSEDDFILIYLGSVGTWYLIDEMLQAFKVLKEKIPAAKILFITYEPQSLVEAAADKVGIDRKDLRVKKASKAEVPLCISIAKWGIFFIKPSYSKMSSSPTKMAEMLFMNKPIICNHPVGDVGPLVKNNNWGTVFSEFTDSSFNATAEFVKNYNEKTLNSIRSSALEIFSLKQGVDNYESIYKSITN